MDDSPAELSLLEKMLDNNGYEVITADNGAEGIALCLDVLPDIALIAVAPPGIDSFQATRQLAGNKKTCHIPIIILSSQLQEADRLWGLRLGAKGIMTKPVAEDVLLQTLDNILEKASA